MLGNLSALAITSLISLGSYAYSVAIPKAPRLVSPLPLHNSKPTAIITLTPTLVLTATPTIFPPTSTPTASPMPSPTPIESEQAPAPTTAAIITSSDLESLFEKSAGEFSVDKELLKKIARCESGFNTNAENGDYHGMFQFAASSWISTRQAMSLNTNTDLRKNTEEAIRTAAFKISLGGVNAWPSCSR